MFHREYALLQHHEEVSIRRSQKESTASLMIKISPSPHSQLERESCSLRQRHQAGSSTMPTNSTDVALRTPHTAQHSATSHHSWQGNKMLCLQQNNRHLLSRVETNPSSAYPIFRRSQRSSTANLPHSAQLLRNLRSHHPLLLTEHTHSTTISMLFHFAFLCVPVCKAALITWLCWDITFTKASVELPTCKTFHI